MQNQRDTQSFDFLAKNSIPQDQKSLTYNFIKYVMENITAKKLAIGLVLMSACYTVTSIPYYIYQSSMQSSAQETKVAEAQLTEEMQIIKKITPEEMNNIITFIQKNKESEVTRITELYWKIKYLNEVNPEKYPLTKYVRDMSKLNMQMVNHYNSRINELSLAYKAVISDNKTHNATTYDNENAYGKLIYWKNAMEINANQSFTALDKYVIQWDEDFTDQAGIQKYFNDNKELIANSKVFSTK